MRVACIVEPVPVITVKWSIGVAWVSRNGVGDYFVTFTDPQLLVDYYVAVSAANGEIGFVPLGGRSRWGVKISIVNNKQPVDPEEPEADAYITR